MFWRKDPPLSSPVYSTTSSRRSSADRGPLYPPAGHFQPLQSTLAVDDLEELDPQFDPDPSFRLRRVTTAHSAIVESIANDARQEERRKRRKLFGTLRRKGSKAEKLGESSSGVSLASRKGSWGRKGSSTSVREAKGDDEIPLQVLTLPRDGPQSTTTLGSHSRFGSEAGLHSGAGTSATTPLVGGDGARPDVGLKKRQKGKKVGKPRTIYVNMVTFGCVHLTAFG